MATIEINDAELATLKAQIADLGTVNAPELAAVLDQIAAQPSPIEFETLQLTVTGEGQDDKGVPIFRIAGDVRSSVEGRSVTLDSGRVFPVVSAEYVAGVTTVRFARDADVAGTSFISVVVPIVEQEAVAPGILARVASFFRFGA